ncbi:glycosyltransferase family 2 protein, partial [Olivibacter domesticus]
MNLTAPPSITVLMVTYNAGTYIYESINSVLNQTFTDFELLIYNDGSTDNTQDIVNSINDPRIKYIHNDTNKGLFCARTAALNASLGRYVAILDSDDIAMPGRLSIQYDFMERNPAVALCGSNAVVIDSDGKIIDKAVNKRKLKKANFKAELFFTNIFVNSSAIFRKDIALQVGGYREMAPVEDYDLFVRIAEKHAIYVFNQAFVYYRRHDNNISTRQSKVGDSFLIEIKRNQLDTLDVVGNKYSRFF